jgi:uncharacterized protein YbjT (DUF2867 family)
LKVAVTGATGFIGSFLIDSFLRNTDFQIVAISRYTYQSNNPRIECRQGDLYSLLDCRRLLKGCDVGVYLVHSMSPSARLAQGTFKDFDFILADNFAKAAETNHLKQIVYVSGIVPDKEPALLSDHLHSRLEVEQTLASHNVPCTSLRCGIVLGPGGSSFRIVETLVDRLPIIALPRWTETLTQAIFIRDLVRIIEAVLQKNASSSQVFDLGSPETVPYQYLLQTVAKIKKTKNFFVSIPWIPRWLSKLWVSLISGQPAELVYPLIDSLVHPMTVRTSHRWKEPHWEWTPLDAALQKSIDSNRLPQRPLNKVLQEKTEPASVVQSVQRLPAPPTWSMRRVAHYYIKWLPRFLWPLLKTSVQDDEMLIAFSFYRKPLLRLKLAPESTFKGRELFRITGGLLSKKGAKGRLEFRHSPEDDFFIAAIHGFEPRLPWFIYRYTQALVHKFVMSRFGAQLKKYQNHANRPATP